MDQFKTEFVQIDSINANIPYEQILELLLLSYAEYKKSNIVFSVCNYTLSGLKTKLIGANAMLLRDGDNLIGFRVLYTRNHLGSKVGYNELLAIHPNYRKLGLATKMFVSQLNNCRNKGYKYIESDTSVYATQSINWHLKNGFQIIGYESYASTNYYSYIFRYSIDGHQNRFANKIRFWCSYTLCKAFKKKDGTYTMIGETVKLLYKTLNHA